MLRNIWLEWISYFKSIYWTNKSYSEVRHFNDAINCWDNISSKIHEWTKRCGTTFWNNDWITRYYGLNAASENQKHLVRLQWLQFSEVNTSKRLGLILSKYIWRHNTKLLRWAYSTWPPLWLSIKY